MRTASHAKRRKQERKRRRRETARRVARPLLAAGAAIADALRRPPKAGDGPFPFGPNYDDGGAPVREPRRPRPNPPLSGAVALEVPPADEATDAVATQPPT